MLSNDDLQAIGAVVDEKIQANNVWIDKLFDTKLDAKLEPVLEAVRDGFEEMDRRWDAKLAAQKHELMDHTDRTVQKTVGELRSELRERGLIG